MRVSIYNRQTVGGRRQYFLADKSSTGPFYLRYEKDNHNHQYQPEPVDCWAVDHGALQCGIAGQGDWQRDYKRQQRGDLLGHVDGGGHGLLQAGARDRRIHHPYRDLRGRCQQQRQRLGWVHADRELG